MAETGLFSLIIALFFSFFLVLIPGIGLYRQRESWIAAAAYYTAGLFLFIAIAYLCLTVCFLQNDFSVVYVLRNSSISLPWFYKLCAVWGGHEGSMLLWVAILSLWTVAVTVFSKNLHPHFRARVLVVLGLLSSGFILFLLTTSNPFQRQFQILATEGRDLNPLLQDPGFLFHPPMLYMGYVGFAVAFAFAIAALWMKRLEPSWAKWTRPWTLAAWCCLTAGITLGSWWAYRELGWGGWWFWDPVENASFMPWLAGTALLHSLAMSEKRQQFMAWTLLLAISTFSLSLVGTFLVRSGVLTSVHAFAVDPARGAYILGFLLVVIGGSLLLFALRSQSLQKPEKPALFSRDSMLLLNNILLTVMMLSVLLGTLYPLIIDGLGLGKLSVGAPYFNAIFVPFMLILMVLMGIGVHVKWRHDKGTRIFHSLKWIIAASLILSFCLLGIVTETINWTTLIGLLLAIWVILSTVFLLFQRWRQGGALSQSFLGMILAHCGVAVAVIGVAISTGYGIEEEVRMAPGDSIVLSGYTIRFVKEMPLQGANYTGARARFSITRGSKTATIYPEKRQYTVGQMALTDSAIDVNPFRDIYIALGEPLDKSAWGVRVYFKPFVRWIWGGGFFILLGGLLALSDRRYYRQIKQAPELVEKAII